MTAVPESCATGAPPTADDLKLYLSITSTTTAIDELLAECCNVATWYELSRLSAVLMQLHGFAPPNELPVEVAQAMLMRAAALYRRRNSVNGFEGFSDIGAIAVRASDPDIERLVDPWRAWSYA